MKVLPDLRGVMLEDCWVLGWSREPARIEFNIEASLWPEHPLYETPRPEEWTCYKAAVLRFDGVENAEGLVSMEDILASIDEDGAADYGNIESLSVTHTGYVITGEFGHVVIHAATCELIFAEAQQYVAVNRTKLRSG